METKTEKRRRMILSGNLAKTLIVIILPLAVYQFFNSTYTLLDHIICAQISTTAQNAVSSISQIKSTISAFGGGLAAGGAVIVSRYFGGGDVSNARHASSNLFMMAIIMSGLLCLFFIPLAKPIMQLCQIAPQSIEIGVGYFRLQLLELAFVSINSVFIGLEKSKGNSKIIMVLNLAVLVLKLGLTCLFVFGFKFQDIIYVELSTIIAQGALTIIALFILFGKKNILRLSLKMIIPEKKYVLPILKLSIPIFLGKFVMSLGKVTVNAICGGYWNEVTDGLIVGTLGVSNNICGMITSPTNSFEEGGSTIVSQNLGNKNMRRAIKSFIYSLIGVTVISMIGYILMRFVFIDQLVNLFASSDEKSAEYVVMVKEIFVWDSLSIPTLGVTAAVLGLLYGFGQTGLSTILNLSRIGSRIIFLIVIHSINPELSPTLCAGLSMGISNTIILIVSVMFLIIFLLRVRKKGYMGMHMTDPEPEVSALRFDEDDNNKNSDDEIKDEELSVIDE